MKSGEHMLNNRIGGALTGALIITFGTMLTGPAPAQAQAALAKANSESSSSVRVEVTELRRTSGDTVTLKGVFINDSDKTFNPSAMNKVYLLNTDNKMKHTVVKDARGKAVSSPSNNVKAKTRTEFWAKFVAPPQNVKTLTVVIPKFAPLEDVPLGQ
jgi:hypothetical protein